MAEQTVSAREGIDERPPSEMIPGIFHRFAIQEVLGITDVRHDSEDDEGSPPGTPDHVRHQDTSQYRPGAWSFQPRISSENSIASGERTLFNKLTGARAYHNPRRMTVALESPMVSYATLNEDVMPELYEVQPLTIIEFGIPVGQPAATYDMQRGSDEERSLVMTSVRCPSEAVPIETEVTCFHPLSTEYKVDDSLMYLGDVYVTKEHMKIVADLASFKNMFDHVAYETSMNERSVSEVLVDPASRSFPFDEDVKSAPYMPRFRGDITLVRTDRSDIEHPPNTTVASHFPFRKNATRPSADDEFSFLTFAQDSPETMRGIDVMIAHSHMAT
ncbi:hypothetical protein L202_08405 [Cryptococcus amylolentus CBS 6039]|uniref:Uncharacterized protein n=2 Tax=Cryptococcus amylolentus TaxID=104669 RepID=A0A1E3HB50_9TREE|nr:hypothetical protein L202_08405 [Cryptococcus amylolentus CBS 6039]ODN73006.1 hypothetical protein L202_08405 [Cryptococcus amylolentus CBS 6039]ODN98163.1 hypothetical protein I350_07809 [Cryptococcus amylolentus CBS 6273]